MSDALVTGLGAVTPAGGDVATTWATLLAGGTCVQAWPDLADEGFPASMAARVVDDRLTAPLVRGQDLAVLAAAEALAHAGIADGDGVGVFLGTTMGESAVFEAAMDAGFDLERGGGQVLAQAVGDRLGLSGPRRTFGAACAAGNYAIGAAARAVASGRLEVAVAGGAEPFSRIALLGFARMRAVAPDGCRPFAAGRRGMTLGEAAAFVVVESAEHAARRGATPLARIGGLGLAADAHHPTAPRPDGSGMADAMQAGLRAAGLAPSDVGWVSAHGTGTPLSDTAEAQALHATFGAGPPPVSSIKGAIGHSLGAATAVEAVVSVLALRDGVLPPNVAEGDPELDLDVVADARPADLDWVMSCGYAFGGLNSALLLGRVS